MNPTEIERDAYQLTSRSDANAVWNLLTAVAVGSWVDYSRCRDTDLYGMHPLVAAIHGVARYADEHDITLDE